MGFTTGHCRNRFLGCSAAAGRLGKRRTKHKPTARPGKTDATTARWQRRTTGWSEQQWLKQLEPGGQTATPATTPTTAANAAKSTGTTRRQPGKQLKPTTIGQSTTTTTSTSPRRQPTARCTNPDIFRQAGTSQLDA
uniref:(northern house mosquito) hypothetical protein n=1 Tax=Culex pipiens TaxID=7175 RepID=A0A8D8CRS2_CULPI